MSAPFQAAVLEAARDYLSEGAGTPVKAFVDRRRRAFAKAFPALCPLQFAFASALSHAIGMVIITAEKIAELRASRSAGGGDGASAS